ncbi:hypothetical protein, partial [Mycobacterium sp.]|uniref:hypothetical protein n=1 Tax=Mycobacterium sp. TaxID=1785 RepID=UPI002BA87EE0
MRQSRVWRSARMMVLLVPMVMTLLWAGAGAASAATLTVCPSGCQYSQIGPAVAAASNGETIKVGPGTYQGGITIDVSVQLAGAGAGSTIIRGGDHVLTIGSFRASHEPTVSVSGVTVTGGLARSSPISEPVFGVKGLWAAGGGVEIPPQDIPADAPPVNGATVTISDSVITGNRADPSAAIPSGIKCPGGFPHGQCPFAAAVGGGIESWGNLTLVHTTVSNNIAGPAAGLPAVCSDCDGGGIFSEQGGLTMTGTTLSGNRAIAAAPNGRFAEGGAVYASPDFGGSNALTVNNSSVIGNSAGLTTNLPKFAGGQLIELNANSGGIHVGNNVPTTVDNTAITNNSVTSKDLRGEAGGIDTAMNVGDSPLTMSNSTVSGNTLFSTVATTADAGAAGSALELDGGGTITNTRITGNSTTIVSPGGVAGNAGAGLVMLNFNNDARLVTVRGGVISGNTALATTSTGSATSQGAGIFNDSLLELDGVQVSGNSGKATGPGGVAQGAGIWNGTDIS